MLFDMVCSCGAAIQIDVEPTEDDNSVWLLINRFVNAHVKCGFMTPLRTDKDPSTTSFNMDISENG
jgi:hypothetical protein